MGTHCSVSYGDYRLQTGKLMEYEGEGKCKGSEGSTNSWALCLGRMMALWIGIDYPEGKLGQVIKIREDGGASFGYRMYKSIFLYIKSLFRTLEAQLNFQSDAKAPKLWKLCEFKAPETVGLHFLSQCVGFFLFSKNVYLIFTHKGDWNKELLNVSTCSEET